MAEYWRHLHKNKQQKNSKNTTQPEQQPTLHERLLQYLVTKYAGDMQVKDSLILTVRSWNHVIIYMLIKHIKNTQSKQLELLLSSLFLSFTRWHEPPSSTSAQGCLADWPNAQPQGSDKCSVPRHHQACPTVYVKCRCSATALFL